MDTTPGRLAPCRAPPAAPRRPPPAGRRPRGRAGAADGRSPEAGLASSGADPPHPQRQAQQAAQGRGHSQDLPTLHGQRALVRRYGTAHPAGHRRPARDRRPERGKCRWRSPPP